MTIRAHTGNESVSRVLDSAVSRQSRRGAASAWARVLERVVHLITRSTGHKVSFSPWLNDSPAATDGQNIFLSESILDPTSQWGTDDPKRQAVHVKALVYHELGHILYSPRKGSRLFDLLHDASGFHGDRYRGLATLHKVWNILEDGRMESLFVSRFSRAAAYFKVVVLEWLATSEAAAGPASNDLLVVGRSYLPSSIRSTCRRQLFAKVGNDIGAELLSHVRRFHLAATADEAAAAVIAVHDLLDDAGHLQRESDNGPVGDDHSRQTEGTPDEGGTTVDPDAEADDLDEADVYADGGGQPTDDDGEASDGEPESDGDAGSEGGAGEDDTADGDADVDGDPGDGGSSGTSDTASDGVDPDADTDAAGGTHTPTDSDTPPSIEEIRELADAELREAEVEIADEAEDLARAIESERSSAGGSHGDTETRLSATEAQVSPIDSLIQHRVEESLRQLREDVAPQADRRQRSGRLDTRRYLDPHRQAHEVDVFQNTVQGYGLDCELVILLDTSGSMGGSLIRDASTALWALTGAAAAEGIRTSVLTFAAVSDWGLLKGSDDAHDNGVILIPKANGGTQPAEPLAWAVNYLRTESDAGRKLVVVLTDGEWNGNASLYRAILDLADEADIESLLLTIGVGAEYTLENIERVGGYGFGQSLAARDILGVPAVVEKWVSDLHRH